MSVPRRLRLVKEWEYELLKLADDEEKMNAPLEKARARAAKAQEDLEHRLQKLHGIHQRASGLRGHVETARRLGATFYRTSVEGGWPMIRFFDDQGHEKTLARGLAKGADE